MVDDSMITDEEGSSTRVLELKLDVSILDVVQMIEVCRREVELREVVSEQGTTVVIVVIRLVVNVLLAVSGQLVTLSGHLVTVSISVEMIVDVVERAEVVRAPTRVLLLLYVPNVAELCDCVVGNAVEVLKIERPLVLRVTVPVKLAEYEVEYGVTMLELVEVSEQGTTVVMVATRVVK